MGHCVGSLITGGSLELCIVLVMYEEAGQCRAQWPGELPPQSHDPVTRGFLKQRHRVNYDRARG